MSTITKAKTTRFIWKSLICRFRILHTIITDNDKQFNNVHYRKFYVELSIECHFSSFMHPQVNKQVEAINKIIKQNLKMKLVDLKDAWVDELPRVL